MEKENISISNPTTLTLKSEPVPRWIQLLRWSFALGVFLCGLSVFFYAAGWNWLFKGWSPTIGVTISLCVTASLALSLLCFRWGKLLGPLFAIRKTEDRQWVFEGRTNKVGPMFSVALTATLFAVTIFCFSKFTSSFPLPSNAKKVALNFSPPETSETIVPVYFWDYATWFDPDWFDEFEIVLPYEKGPPKKLLSKIYFQNTKTRKVELELHGRRPRQYSDEAVFNIFSDIQLGFWHPKSWPLLFNLTREAGLVSEGRIPDLENLYLLRMSHNSSNTTQAIGVPWEPLLSTLEPNTKTNPLSGRMFFWGPDGSVFQMRCANPCKMARFLELIKFPRDPRGSFAARRDWTMTKLGTMLKKAPVKDSPERKRYEKILKLYLLSVLTIDPRDPEAYFHLGKLTTSSQTLTATIRYGKDVGLHPAKIAELESMLAN